MGDVLGVPYEFVERNEIILPVKLKGYGSHNQPAGSWSDDTSMTLCLISNLISGYDKNALIKSYCDWYYYGDWTYNDKLPFDIGYSTFRALSKAKAGINDGETGETSENNNGNGSLMRVLPLIFYCVNMPNEEKFNLIHEISGITHAHLRSKIGCSIYVEYGIQLLRKNSPLSAYKEMQNVMKDYYKGTIYEEELSHFKRILNSNISLLSVEEINSTGYIVDTLEACLWGFINSENYKESVCKVIELGNDTDTIGALTGGLAGMYYGVESIPNKWKNKVAKKKTIDILIKRFYDTMIKMTN